MNIIFGGVFNPPTIAHFEAAKTVIEELKPDNFIFLPAGETYSDKTVDESIHRLKMVEIMATKLGAVVSRVEIDAKEYLGSYLSMKKIGLDNMKFLMGSDNLKLFAEWRNTDKLMKEFGLVVLSRQDDIQDIIESIPVLRKYKDNILVINNFDYDISSTEYRKTHNSKLLVDEVRKYIEKNSLYLEETNV